MNYYEYIITNMNWDNVNKFKKHIIINYYTNFEKDHN
jgi:hypothetical protein